MDSKFSSQAGILRVYKATKQRIKYKFKFRQSKDRETMKYETPLEYIMTYGWILLMIAIIFVVVSFFIKISANEEAIGFILVKPVYGSWKYNAANGLLEMEMTNSGKNPITILSVYARLEDGPLAANSAPQISRLYPTDKARIVITDLSPNTVEPGDPFIIKLVITYSDDITGKQSIDVGTLYGQAL